MAVASISNQASSLKNKLSLPLIFGLGLALLGAVQAFRALLALNDPVVIDFCEMMIGTATQQLRHTGSLAEIYAPTITPYQMPGVAYPPLFILLTATLAEFTGWQIVFTERLLAWIVYVLSAGLVGGLVWQATRHKLAAVVAAGLPFCFWSVIIFAHAGRVDPLALFFSLLATFIYRRYGFAPPGLVVVALLAVLAFFSKQTYLAVSAAVFTDLFLKSFYASGDKSTLRLDRRVISALFSRPVVVFTSAWLVFGGVGMALCGIVSHGTYFGIFEPARAGSFIFDLAPFFVGFFLLDHAPLLVLAVFALSRWGRGNERFWSIYATFAALTCLSIVKDGAVDYYFNELAYILCVPVGILLARLSQLTPKINRQVAIGLGLQVIIAIVMLIGWSYSKDFEASRRAYNIGLEQTRAAFSTNQNGTDPPPLVLVNSFLIDLDKPELAGDYFVWSVLLNNGGRSYQPLLKDVEDGRWGFIIAEKFVKFPPPVEAALSRRYNRSNINGDDGRELYRIYTLLAKR